MAEKHDRYIIRIQEDMSDYKDIYEAFLVQNQIAKFGKRKVWHEFIRMDNKNLFLVVRSYYSYYIEELLRCIPNIPEVYEYTDDVCSLYNKYKRYHHMLVSPDTLTKAYNDFFNELFHNRLVCVDTYYVRKEEHDIRYCKESVVNPSIVLVTPLSGDVFHRFDSTNPKHKALPYGMFVYKKRDHYTVLYNKTIL